MMKKIHFLLTVLFCALILASCGKDDEDSDSASNKKMVKFGGNEYAISAAGINGFNHTKGDDAGTSQYMISLSSGNANATTAKLVSINLAVHFKTSEGIAGSYSIDSESRNIDSWNTFCMYTEMTNGGVVKNESYNDLTEGTCTIKHNGGSNYTVSFRFKPKDGEIVEGIYTGDMIVNIQNI